MGLGKSLTALLWAYRNDECRPVIIVCPASLKWNWQRECATHFNLLAHVLETTKPLPPKLGICDFYIINYDILGPWLPFLLSLKPKLVILDECHYISNRRVKRTKHTRDLCKDAPHIIAISGTPLTNRPAELWNVLNILRPDHFPSFWSFAHKYCNPRLKPWGWDFTGASDLPTLHHELSLQLMIRRLKQDVLSQLPPKQRAVVPLEIEKRSQYNAASRDLIAWLARTSKTRAKKAAKVEQLARVSYLKQLAGTLKLKSALDWIDNFLEESDEKIILFAVHKAVVARVSQHYKGRCAVVTGDVVGQKRQRAFDQFLKDKRIRIFIGNTRAAGVGWSAKGVGTVAFLELDWVPGVHAQCEDRVSGIGRGIEGKHSQIFYLIARGTIEEKLCSIIQKKQKVVSATLDGKNGEEMPIFDQLIKEILDEDQHASEKDH